ncbi:hypothetical protein EZ428_18370 [Pedobacter frigiditerrae]|uniref:Polysaccharide lyase n=1 Tax=Pedobacter frigiditerrae TaxID=2530452 RepID=A0A4R0MP66_9SPHI|nr:heparin lyase I family protein [Pedobacter frigiditerrae]TCC88605.1 hypothetical protein EZ428_18370 [Pedobacter frigiditerrae]
MNKNLKSKIFAMVISMPMFLAACYKTEPLVYDKASGPSLEINSLLTNSNEKETSFETAVNDPNPNSDPNRVNNVLYPFWPRNTTNGNEVQRIQSGAGAKDGTWSAKFIWSENNVLLSGGEPTRNTKGAELTQDANFIKEDGWFGGAYYLPTGGTNFPINKNTIILQGINNVNAGCTALNTWTWHLGIESDGKLYLTWRYGAGGSTKQFIANAQVNLWKSLVIHVRYSRNGTGMIEVWHGDATLNQSNPTFTISGINIGQDCWNGDSLQNGTPIKFGMYCHDHANYTNGETRVLYWDMPSVLVGNPSDAWRKVNPYQPNY